MLLSMTGFGRAQETINNKKFTVEIKSLNSKQLDLFTKVAGQYKEKDLELRTYLSKKLIRGKAELSLQYEVTGEEKRLSLNKELFKQYYSDLKALTAEMDHSEPVDFISLVTKMPDVMKAEKEEIDEKEWKQVLVLVDQAFAAFLEFRKQEGHVLETDFKTRIQNIRDLLDAVVPLEVERMELIKERLSKSVQEIQDKIKDENRFEQELIYYLEKLDITEEKVRLKNHLDYFDETLSEEETQGKKLGFIGQEIGREINTMGSKANHAGIQKLVVQMKDELEKIKEQVLNVL